jgi:hypothetical protein
MSKVSQFLVKYPAVDGYTLICVCEEINRRTGAGIGVDGILTQALLLDNAGEYLVRVCESFQNQSSN